MALLDGPLSPANPSCPLPAYVEMLPLLITRIRLFCVSVTYNDVPKIAKSYGKLRVADVALPWSPPYPATPTPATFVMTPVAWSTTSTRWLYVSTT